MLYYRGYYSTVNGYNREYRGYTTITVDDLRYCLHSGCTSNGVGTMPMMLNHAQVTADVIAAERLLVAMIGEPRAEPVALDQTTSFIDAWHHAVKLLGTPVFVGMALVEAHYDGNPWLTPQQVAVRADVSVDTARRRLGELVHCGRARAARWEGPGRVYRIEPHVAESVMARLASQVPVPGVFPGYG